MACDFVSRRKVARDAWKQKKTNFSRHTVPGRMHLVIGRSRRVSSHWPGKETRTESPGICRLRELPGVPREVLSALVHFLPRPGHAALHASFAKGKLTPQKKDITIGKSRYEADISGDKGWVVEKGKWPWNRKKYPIEHVLGGKNVYYFLTPMERGRLQVLPVAYDVAKKEWFDTAASGVRHFPGRSERTSRCTGKISPTPSTPPATAAM